MKKRFFPTIAAMVAFLLLFWYANLFEVSEIPEPGKDLPVELAKLNAADVKKLAWKTPGFPDIVVESNMEGFGQRFQIVQPMKLRGEAGELNGILRNFEDLKSERTILAQATDTAMFGIGSQSPTLTLETATQTLILTLGDRNPVGGHYMTRSGNPGLFLVSGAVDMAFRKTVTDLRARNFFHEDFTNIASLTIETPSGTIRLERNASDEWKILEPRILPANNVEVSALIRVIHDLRASRFAQDNTPESDLDKYGLKKPVSRARLFDPSGRIFELNVGREEGGEVFVMRNEDQTVYVLAKTSLGMLERDTNALRSKELVSVSRELVESVKVSAATSTAEVTRVEKEWKCKDRVVNAVLVNGLIDAVNSSRVQSFHPWQDRESFGLGRPDGCERIILSYPGGRTEIFLGKAEGGSFYAYIEGVKEVFLLHGDLHKALMELLSEADKKSLPENASSTIAATGSVSPLPLAGSGK